MSALDRVMLLVVVGDVASFAAGVGAVLLTIRSIYPRHPRRLKRRERTELEANLREQFRNAIQ